ncbi:acyltransferase [Pseudoalteromonas gelatinilytica]|uniref:acyltransferase n=1 Tax=Pseudoalteromonas gelatinilytica TaxID=1703256 RepID=UPI0007C50A2D|nr:acyltransferase [Pseudoalteromonas gelatinilytica]
MINRIMKLYQDSGLLLFCVRIPLRFLKVFFDILNTLFYKAVCKKVGKNVRIEFGARIESPKLVTIGNGVFIGKGTLLVSENNTGECIIEDKVHICRNCHLDHTGGLTIRNNTLLSEGVVIYSHSHGYDPKSKPVGIEKEIAANCWLGTRAILLETAESIAEKTIVASAAVVSKSITEKQCIFGGVPAKRIKQYND